MDPDKPLDGKVAIVTGAGRGIGRAIALAYASAGAAVSCAARTASEINSTVAEIRMLGVQGMAIPTDVTNLKSVEEAFEVTVDTLGGLDILVANAGGNYEHRRVVDSDPQAWVDTLNVNLVGAYHCVKTAIPFMEARGRGKIILIGSGLGHRGRAGASANACSKAAVWMLTRVVAQEVWQLNISVNEIVPGPVESAVGSAYHAESESSVFHIESEWIKEPRDVTPLALFLATLPDKGPTGQSYSLLRRDN